MVSPIPSLAVASLIAVAGLGAEAASAAPARSVLTIGVSQSVDSWSPFLGQTLLATTVYRQLYDSLTAYDAKDNHTVGGQADTWSASKDKLTWTFHIRDGMRWSDGRPITARDSAFTLSTMIKDPGAATANGNFVANFASATATDAHTLTVKLKAPQATMTALDIPIVPEHVWKRVKDFSKFNNDRTFPVVGSGPFVLSGYRADQYIRLTANKDYWRGAPKFDQLEYRFYKDNDAAAEALRKGEVDFLSGLTPPQATSLAEEKNITVNRAASGKRFQALAVNDGAETRDGTPFGDANPALKNRAVRLALDHAVNKQTLIKYVQGGAATKATGYIPARYRDYHWDAPPAQERRFDPERAGRLLDGAGYRRRSADGMRETPGGKPFTLRLVGHNDQPADKQNTQYIKEWFNRIGIGLDTSFVDSAGYSEKLTTGNWDLAFDGWTVNPDPDYVLGMQRCAALPVRPGESSASDMFYCDKTWDRLYERQLAEYRPAERQALVKRMQQHLYGQGYLLMLYYPGQVEAYRSDRVRNLQRQPDPGGNIWGQDGMWSWWAATPVGSGGGSSDSARGSGGVAEARRVVGTGAGLLVLLAGGGVLLMRRRARSADDRE